MNPIKIEELIDKLDFQMEVCRQFFIKETGQFVEIQEHYLGIAEELDEDDDMSEYEDWEQEQIKAAIDLFENEESYIELPDQYDINEYSIMEDFCYSIEDENLRNALCIAISGKGAFRRFKDTISRSGVKDHWYAYKHKALGQVARDWCEVHEVPYHEE